MEKKEKIVFKIKRVSHTNLGNTYFTLCNEKGEIVGRIMLKTTIPFRPYYRVIIE
ncbi:MAG: hypothetical protein ACTSR0_04155 [Candidatus Asgardarchaeia archaeon]